MAALRSRGVRLSALTLLLALGCDEGGGGGSAPAPSPPSDVASQTMPPTFAQAAADGALAPTSGDGGVDGQPEVVDAGRVWPTCEPMPDDSDAGISPYDDECLFDERQGLFVDPERGDDSRADGSRNHPYASLAAAIANAADQGKRVYACAGLYEEPMRVGTERANGLQIFGGLSCETYLPDPGAVSVVRASGAAAALVIGETDAIRIERFEFEATPGESPEPGATYVGALIQDATGVVLRDVVLRAADGEDAAAAEAFDEAAASGIVGPDGADACESEPNFGGGPVSTPGCNQANTTGGKGGDGGSGSGDGGRGNWANFINNGGLGQSGTGWSCTPGSGVGNAQSNPGFDGQQGAGARGFGALVGGRFSGFSGQPGFPGGPGFGGAGGGGARAPGSCSGLATPSGASGGGGGGGGCGGAGGRGGPAGGSSLGLVSVRAQVRFEGGAIEFGNGGRGGDGGEGQLGGMGAAGGRGGRGVGGSSDACRGTDGSPGGKGGPGGGGNGGHALGVLHLGAQPVLQDVAGEDAERQGGEPGEGAGSVSEPTLRDLLRGSPGVSEFIREM